MREDEYHDEHDEYRRVLRRARRRRRASRTGAAAAAAACRCWSSSSCSWAAPGSAAVGSSTRSARGSAPRPTTPGPAQAAVLYQVKDGATSAEIGRELKAEGRRQERRRVHRGRPQRRQVAQHPGRLLPAEEADEGQRRARGPRRPRQPDAEPGRRARRVRGSRQIVKTIVDKTDIAKKAVTAALANPEAIGLPAEANGQPRGLPLPGDLHRAAEADRGRPDQADGRQERRRSRSRSTWRPRPTKRRPHARAGADGGEHPGVRGQPLRGLPEGRAGALQPARARGCRCSSTRRCPTSASARATCGPRPTERANTSPYNTYAHTGPAAGADRVAGRGDDQGGAAPAKGDWLYFVPDYEHDTTHFSETYAEHQKWVAKLQAYCAQERGVLSDAGPDHWGSPLRGASAPRSRTRCRRRCTGRRTPSSGSTGPTTRVEVDSAGLEEFIDGLDEAWRGLSLTMPLKRTVVPLLDTSDDWVAALRRRQHAACSTRAAGTASTPTSPARSRRWQERLPGAGSIRRRARRRRHGDVGAAGPRRAGVHDGHGARARPGACRGDGRRRQRAPAGAGALGRHPRRTLAGIEADLARHDDPGRGPDRRACSRRAPTSRRCSRWSTTRGRRRSRSAVLEDGRRLVAGLDLLAHQAVGQVQRMTGQDGVGRPAPRGRHARSWRAGLCRSAPNGT